MVSTRRAFPFKKRHPAKVARLKPRRTALMRSSVVRAGLTATFVLLLAATGFVILSDQSQKPAVVRAACAMLRFPSSLHLRFPQAIRSVHLRGYQGHLEAVSSLSLGEKPISSPSRRLQLAPADDGTGAAPSVLITPGPDHGAAGLVTGAASTISITDVKESGGTRVIVEGSTRDLFEMQSSRFSLAPARLQLRPPFPSVQGMEKVELMKVENSVELVTATFSAAGVPASSVEILLDSSSSVRSIGMLPQIVTGSIELRGCTEGLIAIDDHIHTISSKGDLVLTSMDGLSVAALSLEPATPERGAQIRVEGTGKVTSVRRETVELVPTRIADLFARPVYERGVVAAILLGFVAAGAVFLKRALDIIAKAWLPD